MMDGISRAVLVFAALIGGLGPAPAGERPKLSLPLVCEPHKTCFIQNYVDIDRGQGVRDYACGSATYDQHGGVDFRLLSAQATEAGVAVVAAADGVVKAVRDGVKDQFMKDGSASDIKGRECGNGVVIDHGAGWETQYCHLKSGSVAVADGQRVTRGTRLGSVGYSGAADFAHVHLGVLKDGKAVDPFLPDDTDGSCHNAGNEPSSLWEPAANSEFPYRNGELLTAGFAGGEPDHNALELDHRAITAFTAESPLLLIYGRFINLIKGDVIRMIAMGPGGGIVEKESAPLDKNKASYVAYAGLKRGETPWPSGHYEGRVELLRGGAVVATSVAEADVP